MDHQSARIDPICGMPGIVERQGQWFCSEQCIAEDERRRAQGTTPQGYRDPWVWVPCTAVLLSTLGWIWPKAAVVSAIYVGYLRKIVVPFLLGLVLGGLIDHFVPKEYIVKLLSGPRKRVIIRSTLLGFLASSCSHGCLALSLELLVYPIIYFIWKWKFEMREGKAPWIANHQPA